MSDYIQVEFSSVTTEQIDILVAMLSVNGFDGFEERPQVLKAFITAAHFNNEYLKSIADSLHINFSVSVIKQTNWNEAWEKNF